MDAFVKNKLLEWGLEQWTETFQGKSEDSYWLSMHAVYEWKIKMMLEMVIETTTGIITKNGVWNLSFL